MKNNNKGVIILLIIIILILATLFILFATNTIFLIHANFHIYTPFIDKCLSII